MQTHQKHGTVKTGQRRRGPYLCKVLSHIHLAVLFVCGEVTPVTLNKVLDIRANVIVLLRLI